MTQLEFFRDNLHLRRIDPAANMARFYRMVVQPDLVGGATLIREWGRIGSPGRVVTEHYRDEGLAVDALTDLARIKARRGYC